jgi:hypothetical protein
MPVGEEHGARQVVALGQLARWALEPDPALLHEHRPVGHCQREVERLLHEDHRLPRRLQPLEDLEQLLHD